MKLKTYFNAALLCLAASLFAACAGDNLADNNNKENKQEIPQGVRFTINEPKANAKARVVINEDGTVAAKTRNVLSSRTHQAWVPMPFGAITTIFG